MYYINNKLFIKKRNNDMAKKIEISSEMIQEMIRKAINEQKVQKQPKQVKLNEEQLREFVSYSVARILKEELSRNDNKAIKVHFGKDNKRERTPEDDERDAHMFDDDYWVNKMKEREGKDKEEEEGDEDIAGI